MKILLDTNAYSQLMRGNELVYKRLENSEKVLLSVVVIAELLTGFKGGSKEKQNIKILNEFIGNAKVASLDVTIKTATIFSEIKHYLRINGIPIPINDVWIAAHAYEHSAELITFDIHFKIIPKISVWKNLN